MLNFLIIQAEKARFAAIDIYEAFKNAGYISDSISFTTKKVHHGFRYQFDNGTVFTLYDDGYFAKPKEGVAEFWHNGDLGKAYCRTKPFEQQVHIGPARSVIHALVKAAREGSREARYQAESFGIDLWKTE